MRTRSSRLLPAMAAVATISAASAPQAVADNVPAPKPVPGAPVMLQPDVPPTSASPTAPVSGHDLSGLRGELMAKFPDSFGGLYRRSDGGFTVLETAPDGGLEQCARQCLAAAVLPGDTSGSETNVSFGTTTFSLKALESLKNRIQSDSQDLVASGTGVFSAGIDDSTSRVLVTTTINPNTASNMLAARYGEQAATMLRVEQGKPPRFAVDRLTDTTPRNGGDLMVSQDDVNGYREVCTTGYGAHSGSTRGFITAGHCDGLHEGDGAPFKWFNTNNFFPTRNSSTYIGQGSLSNNGFDSGIDTAFIPASVSNIVWTGNATRIYPTGWVNPVVGDTVNQDGAISKTLTGQVKTIDTSFTAAGHTANYMFVVNNPIQGGDSGGPVWRNSGFGPLLTGTISGTNGTDSWDTEINIEVFTTGKTPNTQSNP